MSNPDPDKKPRKDSILDSQLSEDQKEELRRMLMTGFGQDECIEWLRTTCGVVIKSGYTLTKFWQRHCKPVVNERRQFAAVKAEAIVDKAGRTDWNAATMELVKQVSFEMMSGQRIDPKTAEKFIKLILKADAQDQNREKLAKTAKSDIEKGLDALFEEIKGNKKAEVIFAQLQEVVKTA